METERTETVRYERDDRGVVTITIDRPEKRNALSTEVVTELTAAFERAGRDPEARVVVLTGAGEKAFSAGGDLARFLAECDSGEFAQGSAFVRLFETMGTSPLPIVGRINGHCLAGAFGVALACDLLVAVDEAEFGTPEILVGLWPMMIGALILRNVPRKLAMELMLTGRRISAAEAAAAGIVNRVVPRAELDTAVEAFVTTLLRHPRQVVAAGRRAVYLQQDMPLLEALRFLELQLRALLERPEAVAGIRAFFERRQRR